MNDSEHDLREDAATHEGIPNDVALGTDESPGLDDLSLSAGNRIRQFMAETTVRGGASPADVADLYTAQEIVDDDAATAYLDRRFVHGEVLRDWRAFQDNLSSAYLDSPAGTPAHTLLANLELLAARQQSARSIFDDPDEDELLEELRNERVEGRDPLLSDLSDDARRAIERYIIADVLCYGVAPYRVMELRENLSADGDERALQYLDLPFELGNRPDDWDRLRDRALMVRARLEMLGIDSGVAYHQADGQHPDADAAALLTFVDESDRRR